MLDRACLFIGLILLGLATPVDAKDASGAVVLSDARIEQSVAGHMAILEDPTGLLGLQSVTSNTYLDKFVLYDNIPQFSRTKSAYWVRFSVRNGAARTLDRLLVLNYPNHQKATLYMPDGSGGYRERIHHARELVRDVDLVHRLPVYRATLKAGETATFYWRIESPTVRPNIEIWDSSSFLERRVSAEWWYLIFLGVTLAFWLYAFILAIVSRGHLYSALFILASCAVLMQLAVQGHQYVLFGRYGGIFTVAFLLIQAWVSAAFIHFSVLFLGLNTRKGYVRIIFRLLIGVFCVAGVWSLFDYHGALVVHQVCMLSGIPLLMGVGIHMAWPGSRDARLYLLSWSPLILIGGLITLNGTGLIGSVSLGAMLMVVMIPTTLLAFGFSILYRVSRERIEKERFMRSVEMKSNFLATMSHEIRTPLTGVLGMAELLRRTSLSDRQLEYVDIIRSSGGMLMTLLDDVLQLTKAEAGRIPKRRETFQPRQLVDSLVRLFSGQARNKGLTLQVSIASIIPEVLIGDVGRIRQVLLNLLGNAVKFTTTGHVSVSISVAMAKNGELASAQLQYRFMVEDSGPGISEDARSHLFERFTQADPSVSQHFGGTGLGLAISRELVEEMGGEINCQSIVGSGSRFFFDLPLAEGTTVASQRVLAPIDKAVLVVGRVLVVDDVETNRIVIEGLLNAAGIVADTAVNGKDCLAKLADAEYALILMDIHMPELDGMAATRRLRKAGNQIPVIGLSASVLPEDRELHLVSGMNEVLDKPIDPDTLIETIHRVVKQSRPSKNYKINRELIDQALHERHREVLGIEKWDGMLGTFRSDSSVVVQALSEASRRSDLGLIEVHSHRLIGMAGFLGFDALSDQAQAVMNSVQRGVAADVPGQVEELMATHVATLQKL